MIVKFYYYQDLIFITIYYKSILIVWVLKKVKINKKSQYYKFTKQELYFVHHFITYFCK